MTVALRRHRGDHCVRLHLLRRVSLLNHVVSTSLVQWEPLVQTGFRGRKGGVVPGRPPASVGEGSRGLDPSTRVCHHGTCL